jgi:transglutaminase-like putative cysteine protease
MSSGRRTAAAAAATVLASFGLYPVFSGSAWWWAGAGAAATIAGAGTLTRRRRLPALVCLSGGLAGLLLYLNLLFAHGRSLAAVLPTPSSLGYLASLAARGGAETARYAPPVPELGGMVLLATGGIGLAALLTDLIAVRLDSAALAGLPLLLLFAAPFTLSASRGAAGTAAVFGLASAGYLTLLATEGRDRIRAWEQPRDRPPGTSALAATGRRIGLASVVVALFVPLFVPGLHATRLFGGGGGGTGGIGAGGGTLGFPDPQAQISGELRAVRAAPVLAYTSSAAQPGYLQVYVQGDLTDQGWRFGPGLQPLVPVTDSAGSAGAAGTTGADLAVPGLAAGTTTTPVTTKILVSAQPGVNALGALPAPYAPVRITAPGTVQADPGTLMLFDRGAQFPGMRYAVLSRDVAPSAAALAGAAALAPPSIADEYLPVPASYASLRPLAQAITRGATTPYARAVALQDWFAAAGNFSYTLGAAGVTNAAGLRNFLVSSRAGYCQQFAFAMAVLARLDDIPSRVADGFTQGTRQRDGGWLVTTHDAHAWPELYFAGYGWLRFEPTPGGAVGQGSATTPAYAGTGTGTVAPSQENQQAHPAAGGGLAPGSGSGQPATPRRPLSRDGGGGTVLPRQPDGGANPWELAGLALSGLLILLAAAPALARAAIRRRRWRRARTDTALADAAWRELLDDLADYRAGGRACESPRMLARRLARERELAADAAAALRRVTMAAELARYSARPADGTALRADVTAVRRAIAAPAPRRVRWLARGFPPSVLSGLNRALNRIAAAYWKPRSWRRRHRSSNVSMIAARRLPRRRRAPPWPFFPAFLRPPAVVPAECRQLARARTPLSRITTNPAMAR